MRPTWLGVSLMLLSLGSSARGFEVGAVIRRIDVEQRVAVVFANGQERTVPIADNAKIQDGQGRDLEHGLRAQELKAGAEVTLQVEPVNNRPTIVSIRLGGRPAPGARPNAARGASVGRSTVGFNPLTEMTADDRYKNEDGGLYGGGRNEPPETLTAAARTATARIRPLDEEGRPSTQGTIGLVSISMSNATQEFSRFKQLADADELKSPRVTVVDCAQGGQTMARWADPQAACWSEAERRLQQARVSPKQVQVVWLKLANAGPRGDLQEHGRQLERDTRRVLANLVQRFPNLQIAYLGSRIYGGYADGQLNPEPYAYEGAFVTRWLILGQPQAGGQSNATTPPSASQPLLLWGPYLWGDGVTPRSSDGLVWERTDFVEDGTHPSQSGRQKVAEQLLKFFQSDEHAKTWYLK